MATVAAQVIQTLSDSAATKDQCTNVLHFDGDTDYEALATFLASTFTGGATTSPPFTLYNSISALEVKIYDLADAKPRPERAYVKVDVGATGDYGPRLLCQVLSFYYQRNLGTQRGRIFLGPLTANYTESELLPPACQTQAINLAKSLASGVGTWQHVVYSQKNRAVAGQVTNYFASNGWGVQHSRSLAPSNRDLYAP